MDKWEGGNRPATFCAKGHPLTEGNVARVGTGPRNRNGRCKICRREIDAAYRERRKLKALEDAERAEAATKLKTPVPGEA